RGGPLAPLWRHPSLLRRLRGPPDGRHDRERGVHARAAVLRGHGHRYIDVYHDEQYNDDYNGVSDHDQQHDRYHRLTANGLPPTRRATSEVRRQAQRRDWVKSRSREAPARSGRKPGGILVGLRGEGSRNQPGPNTRSNDVKGKRPRQPRLEIWTKS